MELKPKLKDYTEPEFQMFVDKIWNADMRKEEHDRLINHFDRIVGHPMGADLLFYPQDTTNGNSPGAVVYHVKHWHYKKNITPFKDGALPTPAKPAPRLTFAEHATERAERELANAQQLATGISAAEQTIESAFIQLEHAIQRLQTQQNPNATLEGVEKDMRQLEHAQHEVLMAVGAFERQKMGVEFAQKAAQRNLTSNRADRAIWQANLQQATATQGRYLAQSLLITQRHASLYSKAEPLLDRAWEQLMRLRGPGSGTALFRTSTADDMARPDLLLTDAKPLNPRQQVDLQKAIRSAVAELTWQMTNPAGEHSGHYAGVLSFELVSRAKAVRFGLCVALADLSQVGHDWQALAAQRGEVQLPLRMSTATIATTPGSLSRGLKEIRELFQVYITPAMGVLSTKVRVRPAVWHEHANVFRLTTDDPTPSVIEWALPGTYEAPVAANQNRLDSVGFTRSSPVPTLESFDSIDEVRFDDYIVVFPHDSGLDPVYVLFNDRRDCPGVVSGEGPALDSDWQVRAASHEGAAVPALVAGQLHGQIFERFEVFKRAFWKAVAMTPALNAQFNADNQALMLSGSAPRSEQPGSSRTLRILHRVEATQGGGVYDLENMIVRD